MRPGRPFSALAAIAVLLAASLGSLLLPACSREHHPTGLTNNQRPTVAITASATSGPSPLAVTFTAVADDEDGTIASYMWTFSDSGHLHGDTSLVQHTFVAQGDYIVTVRATDDLGAYAEARDTIRVGGADQAPIANAGTDQLNRDPGTTVNLSGSVTEPDGQGFSVQWTQIGGPFVSISNATSLRASFVSVVSTTASYSFRLTATDAGTPRNSGSDNVTITTRMTWNNGVRDVFANRCTSCHFTSNPSGIPSWQGYTETAAFKTSIRSRVSTVGDQMRGFLSTSPIHEPNMIIRWIDDGVPLSNP